MAGRGSGGREARGASLRMTTTVLSFVTALGIGLVGGLMTGFYFERRAVRQSKRDNEEFQRQISVLRTMLSNLGVQHQSVVGKPRTLVDDLDLASRVTARAQKMQDPSGRVHRPELIAYFVERGANPSDVEAVISSMSAVGAKEEGQWLKLP